jgi:hypothetical protein
MDDGHQCCARVLFPALERRRSHHHHATMATPKHAAATLSKPEAEHAKEKLVRALDAFEPAIPTAVIKYYLGGACSPSELQA